jgi:hypothetical protein
MKRRSDGERMALLNEIITNNKRTIRIIWIMNIILSFIIFISFGIGLNIILISEDPNSICYNLNVNNSFPFHLSSNCNPLLYQKPEFLQRPSYCYSGPLNETKYSEYGMRLANYNIICIDKSDEVYLNQVIGSSFMIISFVSIVILIIFNIFNHNTLDF